MTLQTCSPFNYIVIRIWLLKMLLSSHAAMLLAIFFPRSHSLFVDHLNLMKNAKLIFVDSSVVLRER